VVPAPLALSAPQPPPPPPSAPRSAAPPPRGGCLSASPVRLAAVSPCSPPCLFRGDSVPLSFLLVVFEARPNARARYHFAGISPIPVSWGGCGDPRSERRRFVAISAGQSPRWGRSLPGWQWYHPFRASGVSNWRFGYGGATYFRSTFPSAFRTLVVEFIIQIGCASVIELGSTAISSMSIKGGR